MFNFNCTERAGVDLTAIMKVQKIVIDLKPQAQGRVRFASRGKFTVTIDPHKEQKNLARLMVMQQVAKIIEEPVEMDVIFYLPIAKSTSKKKQALMISNEIQHIKRPDLDNFLKHLDYLNGTAIRDDSQIWKITAQKLYDKNPRTEITLRYEEG